VNNFKRCCVIGFSIVFAGCSDQPDKGIGSSNFVFDLNSENLDSKKSANTNEMSLVRTQKKPKCYYHMDVSSVEELDQKNIPIEFNQVWVSLDEYGGFSVSSRRGDLKVLPNSVTSANGDVSNPDPKENYKKWKKIVLMEDIPSDFRKGKIPSLGSPMDIHIGSNSVVAFHLVPDSWVFDSESDGKRMKFKINQSKSAYRGTGGTKYPPYHVEKTPRINGGGKEYELRKDKTMFVRFFPISTNRNDEPAAGDNDSSICYFKYDLPIIIRSDHFGEGDYGRATEVIIDPILTNTGGPIPNSN